MTELIALCPNPYRDNGLEITLKAKSILEEDGFETAICPVFGAGDKKAIPENTVVSTWQEIADRAKLFIVIGGDGTILETVKELDYISTPVLGINLGTKGFMADLQPRELPLILKAARGEFSSGYRMMIDVELIRKGKSIYTGCGLNDVVLHGMGNCIQLTAWCDGDKVMSFSGDGIIVSTPTGSTGYSMSAGGPIVEPGTKVFVVAPICAHLIGSKTFVLDSERTVTLMAEKIHDRRAFLSVDGSDGIGLRNGDTVVIRRSAKTINLIHLGEKSFYEQTFEKLSYKTF